MIVQDDVLGRSAVDEVALDLELDGGRDLEPGAAGGKAHAGVGGTHAGREGAQGTVGAGVRVGADDEVTRHDGAGLGQQRMLDARAALLPIMGHVLLVGKIAHLLGLLGALDVLVGRIVVGHEAHAVAVEDLGGAQLMEHVDGDRRGDVVCQHDVQIALDELAGTDLFEACMGCGNLLGHGHGSWHGLHSFDCSGM